MPYFCLEKITRALNSDEKSVKGSHVHLVGVSYKADVGDLRESPALKLIELLRDEGAEVSYHDPHVSELPDHALASVDLDGSVGRRTASRSSPPTRGSTTASLPRRPSSWSTSATPRARTAPRTDACGSSEAGGRRPRLLGPQSRAEPGRLDGAELAWICEQDEVRLERYGARFPEARKTTSYEDVLADSELDAVAIATPVVTHFELAREALLAGKHVFVEKPLALRRPSASSSSRWPKSARSCSCPATCSSTTRAWPS